MGESAEDRRARAALDPTRWRVGGSPDTKGLTIYQGNRFKLVSVDDAATAAYVVSVLNAYEFQGRRMAAGDPEEAR